MNLLIAFRCLSALGQCCLAKSGGPLKIFQSHPFPTSLQLPRHLAHHFFILLLRPYPSAPPISSTFLSYCSFLLMTDSPPSFQLPPQHPSQVSPVSPTLRITLPFILSAYNFLQLQTPLPSTPGQNIHLFDAFIS